MIVTLLSLLPSPYYTLPISYQWPSYTDSGSIIYLHQISQCFLKAFMCFHPFMMSFLSFATFNDQGNYIDWYGGQEITLWYFNVCQLIVRYQLCPWEINRKWSGGHVIFFWSGCFFSVRHMISNMSSRNSNWSGGHAIYFWSGDVCRYI